ncbi:hypothetical protein D3C78_1002540 [compost metagenome]
MVLSAFSPILTRHKDGPYGGRKGSHVDHAAEGLSHRRAIGRLFAGRAGHGDQPVHPFGPCAGAGGYQRRQPSGKKTAGGEPQPAGRTSVRDNRAPVSGRKRGEGFPARRYGFRGRASACCSGWSRAAAADPFAAEGRAAAAYLFPFSRQFGTGDGTDHRLSRRCRHYRPCTG